MKKSEQNKLRLWQSRMERNKVQYDAELAKMDHREAIYRGTDVFRGITRDDPDGATPHVRNLAGEIVEAQISSAIPQPKVTARRQKDEMKAKLIEDMLRNELDRMPFEMLNDMMERTVPIQGGGMFLVEWDNTRGTHNTVGELNVSILHPKQVIPQDGVYSSIEEMDYIILRIPQTKEYIRRKYNVDVQDESETEPEVKGPDGKSASEDLVTQNIAYYRNEQGGIGLYSWVNDTPLEDLEDYQARRLRRCAQCGELEPARWQEQPQGNREQYVVAEAIPGLPAYTAGVFVVEEETKEKRCPYCGSTKWKEAAEDYEEVFIPIQRSDGSVIPGAKQELRLEEGSDIPVVEQIPTRIPIYKPNIYPVILQKNVSVFGKLLGDSDIDKIENQQNTTNRIEKKIINKLIQSGSYMTLPDEASIEVDTEDMKVIRPGNAATKNLIDVYDLQGNIAQDLTYLNQVYEEARQAIGITDSFQGRTDKTATSGKAKEFSAAQAAGRLESKRVMKDAAYAALFEAMFKFKLAYADEPRPVVSHDIHGNTEYAEFNRYDFLEKDAAGDWYWNDQFLFACDTSAPLAANREAMWQETRMNLQTGAFGDPTNIQTLILFWTKMEMLHYPGASETKSYLEEELERQQMQAARIQEMQAAQMQQGAQTPQMQGMPAQR